MKRVAVRAMLAALAGAVAGAAGLVVTAIWQPGQVFEMDRDPPAIASGFYPAERAGTETFVWTAPRAQITFSGLDRSVPWTCRLRFRGGRPPGLEQPRVDVQVDGVTLLTLTSLNDYQDVEVVTPVRAGARGLVFGVSSSVAFLPGGGDPRQLGVLVDRLECAPPGGAVAWPPAALVAKAAVSGSLFGIALALAGFGVVGAVVGAVALALVQALAVGIGPARFTDFPDLVMGLTLWSSVGLVVVARSIERLRGRASHPAARFTLAFTAGVVLAKLLGLLHPSKPIVDALYHAHRLDWVLTGRVYFTQVMPDGVEFPYAIALYVFATPFAWLTTDHVSLLRVVVTCAEAAAALGLYLLFARVWHDRFAGALAVVAFHLVPGIYPVLGNANFTNSFGQSAALLAVVAAVVLPLGGGRMGSTALLTGLASVALLSHVSTAVQTMVVLVALAFFFRFVGGVRLRAESRTVLISAVAAAVLAVGLYWGHFVETYRTLARVRADAAVTAPLDPSADVQSAEATPRYQRLAGALMLSVTEFGWPLVILAAAGGRRLWVEKRCDRLGFALAAWATAYVAFVGLGVVAPVNQGYERYAAEFVSRVDLAVYPALAILAAVGAAWMWRGSVLLRLASVALVGAAVVGAQREWLRWLTD